MADNYSAYLDYKEIRRRVERRFKKGYWLAGNLALFLLFVLYCTLIGYFYVSPMYPDRSYFIEPAAGVFVTIWSALLFFHSLIAYRKSGAFSERREEAIEGELRERLAQDDTLLLSDRHQAFRIHALLAEDIQQRTRDFTTVLTFTGINAAVWVLWALVGASTPVAWSVTSLLTLLVLLPLLLISRANRRRQDHKLTHTLANWDVQASYAKRKRQMPDYADDYTARLTDDGELVEWDDKQFSQNARKAKR